MQKNHLPLIPAFLAAMPLSAAANTNFTMVVDPEGAQPLIAQRYSAAAVPETSSAVLALLGASVGLRRRRPA